MFVSAIEGGYSKKIAVLSFVLSVLVVIRHTINISTYGLSGGVLYHLERILKVITALAVPTFFSMSGFLFFHNYSSDTLLIKWRRRVNSIVIPYFLWNLIPYIILLFFSAIPAIGAQMNQQIEPLSFRTVLRNAVWGYHNITWFLRSLILYILITPFLYPVLKHKIAGMLLILAFFLANCWIESLYFCYFPLYLIGAYFGINFHTTVYKRNTKSAVIVSAVALAATVLLELSALYDVIGSNFLYYILRSVQVALLWICADCFNYDIKIRWWMSISFFIYCSHSLILEAVEKVILIVLGCNMAGAWVDLLCAPVITLTIIFCIAAFLRKTKYIWPIISGGR